MENKPEEKETKYSVGTRISYGIGGFLDNFVLGAFTVRIVDFYENEIGLSIILLGIAMTIYGLWNMVNDPLLGYLSDRASIFVKRGWGRRFPWYLIGVLTYVWIYLLIFVVPTNDQLGMFFWMLLWLIVFEGLYTLWQANYLALFPTKFESQKERTSAGMWNTIWGVLGIALGVLLPPMLIEYGKPETFVIATLVVAVIAFVLVFFSLPGMKEDENIKVREKKALEKVEDKPSFWEITKIALKDRNFIAYVIAIFGHQVMTVFLLSSLPYWTKFILLSSDPDTETILSAFFLIFTLAVGVPIWSHLGKKLGNQKAFKYGTLVTSLLFIPLIFAWDLLSSALFIAFIGVGIGCIWVLMYPCLSDVIDNIVVQTGQRFEASLSGLRTFFSRAPIILQGVVFAVIHELTGYQSSPVPIVQTDLALFGIRFHMAIIPMIFYFIGFLAMWKIYKLDPECVSQNKVIINEKLL